MSAVTAEPTVLAKPVALSRGYRFELVKLVSQWRIRLVFVACLVAPAVYSAVVSRQTSLPADAVYGRLMNQSGWAGSLAILVFLGAVLDQERAAGELAPYVNINLSLASLARADLADHVLHLLGDVGFRPCRLRIEIPEIADLDAVQHAAPQLKRLQRAGVAVTLEDVGAGSTSLRHITQLAVDGVKIDRSFVAVLPGSERDLAVERMLVDLRAGLGLAVTAEGVETQEQLDELARLGCPFVQGYLLGRPAPLSELALRKLDESMG